MEPKVIEAIMEARRTGTGVRSVPANLRNKGKTSSSFLRIVVKAWVADSPWAVTLTTVVMRQRGLEGEELRTIYWEESRETRST